MFPLYNFYYRENKNMKKISLYITFGIKLSLVIALYLNNWIGYELQEVFTWIFENYIFDYDILYFITYTIHGYINKIQTFIRRLLEFYLGEREYP